MSFSFFLFVKNPQLFRFVFRLSKKLAFQIEIVKNNKKHNNNSFSYSDCQSNQFFRFVFRLSKNKFFSFRLSKKPADQIQILKRNQLIRFRL